MKIDWGWRACVHTHIHASARRGRGRLNSHTLPMSHSLSRSHTHKHTQGQKDGGGQSPQPVSHKSSTRADPSSLHSPSAWKQLQWSLFPRLDFSLSCPSVRHGLWIGVDLRLCSDGFHTLARVRHCPGVQQVSASGHTPGIMNPGKDALRGTHFLTYTLYLTEWLTGLVDCGRSSMLSVSIWICWRVWKVKVYEAGLPDLQIMSLCKTAFWLKMNTLKSSLLVWSQIMVVLLCTEYMVFFFWPLFRSVCSTFGVYYFHVLPLLEWHVCRGCSDIQAVIEGLFVVWPLRQMDARWGALLQTKTA